jgi:hypothetical protein
MRYSCMKVLNEHESDFLAEFSGQFTANDLRNKADSFRRVRRVASQSVSLYIFLLASYNRMM